MIAVHVFVRIWALNSWNTGNEESLAQNKAQEEEGTKCSYVLTSDLLKSPTKEDNELVSLQQGFPQSWYWNNT